MKSKPKSILCYDQNDPTEFQATQKMILEMEEVIQDTDTYFGLPIQSSQHDLLKARTMAYQRQFEKLDSLSTVDLSVMIGKANKTALTDAKQKHEELDERLDILEMLWIRFRNKHFRPSKRTFFVGNQIAAMDSQLIEHDLEVQNPTLTDSQFQFKKDRMVRTPAFNSYEDHEAFVVKTFMGTYEAMSVEELNHFLSNPESAQPRKGKIVRKESEAGRSL